MHTEKAPPQIGGWKQCLEALSEKSQYYLFADVETLVRISDRPPISLQAELLRATNQGTETPSKQLLRAGQENTQNG